MAHERNGIRGLRKNVGHVQFGVDVLHAQMTSKV